MESMILVLWPINSIESAILKDVNIHFSSYKQNVRGFGANTRLK